MENRIIWSLKRSGLWPQHLLIMRTTSAWDGCEPFGDSAKHNGDTATWGRVSLRLSGRARGLCAVATLPPFSSSPLYFLSNAGSAALPG